MFICTLAIGVSEADTPAPPSSTKPAASASIGAGISGGAVALVWIVGKWRDGSSFFGNHPWNSCLLTVTPKQLLWAESSGGPTRKLTYQVVVSKSDFVVLKTEDAKNSQMVCVPHDSPIEYVRFDRNPCTPGNQESVNKAQIVSQGCSKLFNDRYSFVLTLFHTSADALAATAPLPGKLSHGEEWRWEYFVYTP